MNTWTYINDCCRRKKHEKRIFLMRWMQLGFQVTCVQHNIIWTALAWELGTHGKFAKYLCVGYVQVEVLQGPSLQSNHRPWTCVIQCARLINGTQYPLVRIVPDQMTERMLWTLITLTKPVRDTHKFGHRHHWLVAIVAFPFVNKIDV